MKKLTTKSGSEIKLYSSAKELSIARYSEFQKYLAIDAGGVSGLSLSSQRIKAFIEEQQYEDAINESNNLNLRINDVLNGISYVCTAFAILVAEIGLKVPLLPFLGRFSPCRIKKIVCEDISEDGLLQLIKILKSLDFTYSFVEEEVDILKKK